MTWQNFSNLAGGTEPASLFDTLAAQIAQCVIVPCTVSGGANNLTLTPATNAPAVTAYANFMQFSFVPTANSTASVTANIAGLAVLNVFLPGGTTQAGNGALVAGALYVVAFQSTLGSNGGFVISSSTPATISSLPIVVSQGGTGATTFSAYGPIAGGTTATGPLQAISPGTAGQILTSNGAAALPSFQAAGASGSGLVSIITYTTSQTITIPATATKAWIRLVGGGGGSSANGAAGGGGYLEKYLSSLTAGNTLALTIGAGGSAGNNSGGNSILASGTQSITTLTSAGGSGAAANASTAGGAATNGDINITGGTGRNVSLGCAFQVVSGGTTPLATLTSSAGLGYGGGAGDNNAGAAGVCIIAWFT